MIVRENICVEQDDLITRVHGGLRVARRHAANPLRVSDIEAVITAAGGETIVMWSGSLNEQLFEPHPMNWMKPGEEAFSELTQQLSSIASSVDARVLLQPHTRHVLSDTQTTFNFLRSTEGNSAVGLALCPATLLEPSMLNSVEDHLTRIFETLAPVASLILLTDAALGQSEDRIEPVPLGQGLLPQGLIRELADRNVPQSAEVAVLGPSVSAQLAWLGVQ